MRCHSCERPADDLVEVVGGATICQDCYDAQYEFMPKLKHAPVLEEVVNIHHWIPIGCKPKNLNPSWYGDDE
jgi:hypothetical protein